MVMKTQNNALNQQFQEKSKSASDMEIQIAAEVSTLQHIQVMLICFVFMTQQTGTTPRFLDISEICRVFQNLLLNKK